MNQLHNSATNIDIANIHLGNNQILVKVQYSGVNRADLSQKEGKYPAPPGHSLILGLEVFGTVIKCGTNVTQVSIDDEIFALVNGGGYADFCVVEESLALKKPTFLTDIECASIPEAFLTAILNIIEIGNLQKGQTILIHAAASGVGLAMIQLSKLIGANIIATVRSATKIAACKTAGANTVLLQEQSPSFAQQLYSSGEQVDLVVDPVGGNYINQDLELLNFGGKLINFGLMGGSITEINLALILRKNIQLIGSTLRNKPNEIKAKLTNIIKQLILPAIQNGKILLVVDRIFDIDEVELAHSYLRKNQNIGKVLLKHHL